MKYCVESEKLENKRKIVIKALWVQWDDEDDNDEKKLILKRGQECF